MLRWVAGFLPSTVQHISHSSVKLFSVKLVKWSDFLVKCSGSVFGCSWKIWKHWNSQWYVFGPVWSWGCVWCSQKSFSPETWVRKTASSSSEPGESRCQSILWEFLCFDVFMVVSENSGTPKSSILIGFSIINHPFWGPTPIFGNTFMVRDGTCRTWLWSFSKSPPRSPLQRGDRILPPSACRGSRLVANIYRLI